MWFPRVAAVQCGRRGYTQQEGSLGCMGWGSLLSRQTQRASAHAFTPGSRGGQAAGSMWPLSSDRGIFPSVAFASVLCEGDARREKLHPLESPLGGEEGRLTGLPVNTR